MFTDHILFQLAASIGLLAYTGVSDHSQQIQSGNVQQTEGYFTVKGKKETVYMIPPKINADRSDCDGGCAVILKFSDPAIPVIKINNCIGGTPVNLGDLDNDGKDEIGILREWFTSCWRDYDVYTFKNGKWEFAVPPILTHCNQWDDNLKPIVKDPGRKGFAKITYSAFVHNDVTIKTKILPVK